MDRRSVFGIYLMMMSSILLISCKVRGGATPSKDKDSDQSSVLGDNAAAKVDLSKSPLFTHCSAPKDAAQPLDVAIRHDQASGAAQITYRIGQSSEITTNGRWDNYDETSPYQYIYSFESLRFIMTNDQIVAGSYPATFVGSDSSGKYLEQSMTCNKA